MWKVIKKILIICLTLFIVSILIFTVFHIVPGDPAMQILGTEASPERLKLLSHKLGTDKSLTEQYISWIKGFLTGDFGMSIKYSKPVKFLITDRIPVTVTLATISMLLTLVISIPIGVLCGKKKNTFIDGCINTLTMINISVPGFFLGILVIWIFGVLLSFFVPGAYINYKEDFGGFVKYLFFPAVVIAVPNSAVVVKFLRSSILSEMKIDYVRTAFSKGNSKNRVLYIHVLKNAIVPIIPLLGMMVGDIFSGSIILEQVFGIPGIGKLLIAAITARDYPLIQTLVVLIALIIILSNTLVDIVLQVIDPRIRIK